MLPWDQVPEERRAIGNLADPLDDELGLLNVSLAQWIARDDSKADAAVTRAGNQVLDSIDVMLRQLGQLRARMVSEYREHQDVAPAQARESASGRTCSTPGCRPSTGPTTRRAVDHDG